MNWGKGLAVTLIAFAGLMTWFVVKAIQNPEPLVTEHYYEEELVYQDRIDATQRANALSAHAVIAVVNDAIEVRFPSETRAVQVTGTLHLLRPNEPLDDRTVHVTTDTSGVFVTEQLGLKSGRYNAELEWRAGGVAYYTQEKLVVP
ncbi:MAG: FixH family protein [Flavobacteriales bacterium]